MSEISLAPAPDATVNPAPERAFYLPDYKRFGAILRQARDTHGDDTADALAAPIVAAFTADNPNFDSATFLAGTYSVYQTVAALGRALKVGMTAKGMPWQPASDFKVDRVASLAGDLASALATVAPNFDGAKFLAGVTPPVPPVASDTDDSEDESDDSDGYGHL